MKMMTSAYANKVLKTLEEDKQYWMTRENEDCIYTAAVDEEPVIPEYDYRQVADTIDAIDKKICVIKHAINQNNAAAQIQVGDLVMSVDMILVRMAQLNRRKTVLDRMRKRQEKTREMGLFGKRNQVAEYTYINYDLDVVKRDYDAVCDAIMDMQLALDRYNQTIEFEVDI